MLYNFTDPKSPREEREILSSPGATPGAPLSGEDVELSPLLQQADPSEHGLFCYIYNDKYLLKENPKDACDYVSDLGVREDFPG